MLTKLKGTLYPNIQKPLYVQLRDIFVDLIESEELLPGDLIPGERVLAKAYNVSRVTIRKCIDSLVKDGYLVRSQGKQNRVAKKRITHNLGCLLGIVEELYNTNGIVVTAESVHNEYVEAPAVAKKYLQLDEGGNTEVFSFSRILKLDGKPLAFNHSYVPYEIGKLIDSLDFNKDKVFTYLENCGFTISYGEQKISSGLCTKEEAKYLDYMAGQPVLVIKRTTFLENGYPVLYEKTIFRGTDYQYSIRLQRNINS
jgi:GntR family transcriptional regulator